MRQEHLHEALSLAGTSSKMLPSLTSEQRIIFFASGFVDDSKKQRCQYREEELEYPVIYRYEIGIEMCNLTDRIHLVCAMYVILKPK